MDELEKNIKQVVAGKVIKDIHKIVSREEIKEKQEKRWAMFVVGLVLTAVVVLVVLKNLK